MVCVAGFMTHLRPLASHQGISAVALAWPFTWPFTWRYSAASVAKSPGHGIIAVLYVVKQSHSMVQVLAHGQLSGY